MKREKENFDAKVHMSNATSFIGGTLYLFFPSPCYFTPFCNAHIQAYKTEHLQQKKRGIRDAGDVYEYVLTGGEGNKDKKACVC